MVTLVVCLCFLEVGPASMIVGNLVAGKRIAQACGRDVAQLEDNDQARKVVIPISPSHHLHTSTADTGTVTNGGCGIRNTKRGRTLE